MNEPLNITSDITNRCNSRCAICYLTYRDSMAPAVFMTEEQFSIIARKLQPYCGILSLSCSYEPFVHPDVVSLLRQCEIMAGFEIRINSNGIAMYEPVQEALLASAVRRVVISMDAVSPELNQIIRGNNKQEQIIANVRSFIQRRQNRKQTHPALVLRMTLHTLNLPELTALVRLAAELGVDQLVVQPMAPVKGAVIQGQPVENLLLDTSNARVQDVLMEARSIAAAVHLPITLPVIRKTPQQGEHLWVEKKTPSASSNGFHILSNGKCNANIFNVDINGAVIKEGCGDLLLDSVEDILANSRRLRFPGETHNAHGSVP